jgi:molybdenum-dependent DNA-binding transcriptional regulator ModE
VEIRTEISQRVNGHRVTHRQLEALAAVRSEGSKTAAARKLGISVPVLHRYIGSVEEGVGVKMIRSTPNGSVLTDDGSRLLDSATMMELRCAGVQRPAVSCTPVTEELIGEALSRLDSDVDMTVSEDTVNIRLFKEGAADMIFLDDPAHLFNLEGYRWTEIGSMDMVHVDKGPNYIEYVYGAQRIAFMHLEATGKEYRIERRTRSVSDLMDSGKSFFIDRILLAHEGIKIRSATDPRLLRHTVNAVSRGNSETMTEILREVLAMSNNYLNR